MAKKKAHKKYKHETSANGQVGTIEEKVAATKAVTTRAATTETVPPETFLIGSFDLAAWLATRQGQFYALAAMLLVTFFLRFYNLNWDSGGFFHPDERNIANAVQRIRFFSELNPKFFAYGGLTIYIYRAACDLVAWITHNPDWTSDWARINLVGRHFAAFFSTLTVIPIFFLARRLFNNVTALIVGLLYVFCVSSIQIAHYSITESLLTFLITSMCLASLKLVDEPSLKNYLLVFALWGISLAAKTSAISFIVFPLLSHAFVLWKTPNKFENYDWSGTLILAAGYLYALLVARLSLTLVYFVVPIAVHIFLYFKNPLELRRYSLTFVIGIILSYALFRIGSPYTFEKPADWRYIQPAAKFVESMIYENGVVLGTVPVPYTRQFVGTPIFWFQIKNLFWQLGPVALFGWIGMLVIAFRAIRERNAYFIIFLSFPILYFLYVGRWHTKFIRYMMPLIPFLLIAGGYCLWEIKQRAKTAGKAFAGACVAITALWAITFFSVYRNEQTRIAGSRWIYENVPIGSQLYGEHWDDGLPVAIDGYNPGDYRYEQLSIYDDDNDAKLQYYSDKLATGDYILFNSRRLYGTLMYLPEQYPLTSRYYRLLFNGDLGYTKVGEFTSYPQLFGIVINDDKSEETFQVYDHPKVLIYKNERRLSSDSIRTILSRSLMSDLPPANQP